MKQHIENHISPTQAVYLKWQKMSHSLVTKVRSNQSIEYPVIEVSSFGSQSNAYEVIDEEQLQN